MAAFSFAYIIKLMRSLLPIYTANVFLSLHYAAILYTNSSFLSRFFNSNVVSLLFLCAAVLNILLFLIAPRLVDKFSTRSLYLSFLAIVVFSLIGLTQAQTALEAGIYFVLYAGFQFMIYYCLDIFLEDLSINKKTGGIRGFYLTLSSAAIASSPLLLTFFATEGHLKPLYTAAILLLVPPFVLGLTSKASSKSKKLISQYGLPFSAWWQADSVRRATFARLALEIFYALMVIYTPVYLHGVLGFEWKELGIMFTIMLLPFVIFEWPMGIVADKWLGEKEIMSLGFFISGTMLLVMPFLGLTFLYWTIVLFISRIGASFIEISTETHFFKHVDSRDTSLISIFRLARPVGLLLGSLIGISTLNLFSFEKIFFVIAIILLFGLRESLYLKDTL
jgi:MFS family permease